MTSHQQPLEALSLSDRYLFDAFGRGSSLPAKFPTVHASILHYALRNPDSPAVQDMSNGSSRTITYGTLVKLAQHVAFNLRNRGVMPGSRVPLLVKRSVEMVVGIMGILLCGAQYIPLDGGVIPDKTLNHVLSQAGDEAVVCLRQFRKRLGSIDPHKIAHLEDLLEDADLSLDWADADSMEDVVGPNDGCYVIYTSGTTGVPKGVNVTHSNVTNLLCSSPGNLGMRPGLKVGSVLSIGFDMGAWEILGSLCNGSTLVLRGSDWLKTLQEIDVLICTPTILAKYDPTTLPKIKFVGTAGEPLPQRTADTWSNAGKILFCGCGPTEVTIVNTLGIHVPGKPVSIGKPTPNNNVYILDEDLNPVPIGETGVMWAGGKGVTKGYVGLPELTAKKWHYDKFADDHSMMFNTGDLGRWRPDGYLEILGRQDDQVKIKGFRVELDGISASLTACPGVSAAIALLCGETLCAFITPKTCNTKAVKEHMQGLQPYYAIPEKYFTMDDFKMTPNGKIDKKALKEVALTVTVAGGLSEKSDANGSKNSDVMSVSSSEATSMPVTSASSMVDLTKETYDKNGQIPDKSKHLRSLRYRLFIVYRRLFTLLWMANIAALAVILVFPWISREWLGRMSSINLTLAVLARQDFVINALYKITCSVPRSWPLCIRTRCAKIYHFGGVHSGAASAAILWFIIALAHSMEQKLSSDPVRSSRVSSATLTMSWIAMSLLLLVAGVAWPSFRKAHHNLFELVHRFAGWTALAVLWAQTVLSANDSRRPLQSLGAACAESVNFWLILASTISIAISWVTLRKVEVDAEVLSDHAVRLHFDYTVPVNGSFTRLSERPLLEWHSFATIPAPEAVEGRPKGYSLVVSNAGDWTKRQIQRAPRKLWVRGVPTCGVMRIATLFNRVVLVGTGSGIGPLLGFIQKPTCPYRLFWSTPSPEKTFGTAFCQTIKRCDPDAVIHDTRVHGRPDMIKMACNVASDFGAEAVIIIANEKITKLVVYGLEARGIPAYGAIWDS